MGIVKGLVEVFEIKIEVRTWAFQAILVQEFAKCRCTSSRSKSGCLYFLVSNLSNSLDRSGCIFLEEVTDSV